MSHPKWFKIGGFRLWDFRAALEIQEQTLGTVNRQVQLQLTRLREEYDVLVRRKEKLDAEIAAMDDVSGMEGLGRNVDGDDGVDGVNGDDGDSLGEAPPSEGRRRARTTPARRKRGRDREPEHRAEKRERPTRKSARCTHRKKIGHNIRN